MKVELSDFETGRDNIKLPYDRPLPLDLLRRVAEYRVNEVQDGAKWRNSD